MGHTTITECLSEGRILLLDGAMGTMIQTFHFGEQDFRGRRFRDLPGIQQGNNDLLSLTQPDAIRQIHRRYLEAGADIICTNTFNAQRISLADYGCQDLVKEINHAAVVNAREEADAFSSDGHPRFVVASVGPTNKTLSMSPDVNNPAFRAVSYDEMQAAYLEQISVLLESGVDGILLETIFDTLNAKAAVGAFMQAEEQTGISVPLMLSVTVNDRQGRLLSGQTLEAFLTSIQHAPILSMGLNCSFGAREMLPCLRLLAEKAPYYISAHPNAGLPNTLGGYDQTPDIMKAEMQTFLDEQLVNIIGGCCGTTPEHIAALHQLRLKAKAHRPAEARKKLRISGLEPLTVDDGIGFVGVGERCNVAGSRKFLRLIREKNYSEALSIARRQVQDGAMVIDINMDDALLDAKAEMETFLKLIASEPDICRIPVMVDSSNWDTVRAALRCIQGKSIVNSISLKEGEEAFIAHASEIRAMGAAVVVMAFDEQGQADTYERKVSVCHRAYDILVDKVGFPAEDIIFDPNILTIATGMPEHDGYALAFIRAAGWIRKNLPGAHVSGGVSNLSFAFRGNDYLRQAMHAVFLYHAQRHGMDFGIINPATNVQYADIPAEQLAVIEEAMLRPSAQATDRLVALAASLLQQARTEEAPAAAKRTTVPVDERLKEALRQGSEEYLKEDIEEALHLYPKAVDIIEGPLMQGMNLVGTLFGEGKMFLPQVIKTARTMKQAVAILQPHIEAQRTAGSKSAGRVLLATVKGDVHDIGKNIVAVVMACNGYEIIDLGVMVPAEEIVRQAQEQQPDIIGLSGLITPSLEEMVRVVKSLDEAGLRIPVMIGGATTSAMHTALKIAPAYHGPVIWVKDASMNTPVAAQFISTESREAAIQQLLETQESYRREYHDPAIQSFEQAREDKLRLF
ncbi:MAG: methionine synthase [Prevotellaceae bacterium]|nr:methionine synthase [Prevotellaceae bacterium]